MTAIPVEHTYKACPWDACQWSFPGTAPRSALIMARLSDGAAWLVIPDGVGYPL